MKHIFIFSVLFCLVFLNVPRSLVHNCEDHHEVEHHVISDNEKQKQSNDLSFDVEGNTCFVCEFDLGFFHIPDFRLPAFAKYFNYTFVTPSVDYCNPEEFNAFSHRGPPAA